MSKVVKIIVVVVLLVALVFGVSLFLKHQKAQKAIESKAKVENFIKTNISTISPYKERAGTFFKVTSISFDSNSGGIVYYENGSVNLKALFTYSVDDQGVVTITHFELI